MKKLAFFDTKPYDKIWFDKINTKYNIVYFESKLRRESAHIAKGYDAVCAFVNDVIDKETIDILIDNKIEIIAMRCAGYSNVDIKAASNKLKIVRVPEYSPYAVAEYAMGLLLSLNRKIHKAYNRTRDFNFSLVGLTGVDLHCKTVGIIGTGKIGRVFIDICKGFGLNILAYDLYPLKNTDINYVDLNTLFMESDIISLHCPLTKDTKYILDEKSFAKMKKEVFIINTSRGALIETAALLDALNNEKIRGAALDVYEEEGEFFGEDFSTTIVKDELLSILISRPNVILTSHQAYLTEEALGNITKTTLSNLDEFFNGKVLTNEVK